MDKIKNLLQQVSIIQKKYDDLAEYSGEHYNVFDILGIRSDELSHSSILTNLLNAKGRHGQKDLFLKLFIDTVKNAFENDESKMQLLNNFNSANSKAEKEKFAGKVNYEAEQGGRIDIIINDGKNNIIIENKVYAGDQPLQLVRYNEYDKNAPILYLTLDGKEASENSKGTLRNGNEYACISYQIEIVNWLEKSIKEMANKPIIRETLNQYLFLIKSLTNQSNNNKMSDEIVERMKENISESFEIANNIRALKKKIYDVFIESLKISNELKFENCENTTYYGVDVVLENKKRISILFGKDRKNDDFAQDVSIGFLIDEKISEEIKNKYRNNGFTVNGWVYKRFSTYADNSYNWTNNIAFWEDIKKGTYSLFYKDIKEIIQEIIEIEKIN